MVHQKQAPMACPAMGACFWFARSEDSNRATAPQRRNQQSCGLLVSPRESPRGSSRPVARRGGRALRKRKAYFFCITLRESRRLCTIGDENSSCRVGIRPPGHHRQRRLDRHRGAGAARGHHWRRQRHRRRQRRGEGYPPRTAWLWATPAASSGGWTDRARQEWSARQNHTSKVQARKTPALLCGGALPKQSEPQFWGRGGATRSR